MGEKGGIVKLHWGRISVKTVLVLVYFGALSVFDRLVNPALAPQVAHIQLEDTAESSAMFSTYGWVTEVAWVLLVLLVIALVAHEVWAMLAETKTKEERS